jgi:putative ABC transport system ATP-binding protein
MSERLHRQDTPDLLQCAARAHTLISKCIHVQLARVKTIRACLPLRLRRAPHDEREARVAELLDLVGLTAHAGQRPSEMSGGQQQRVAVARALANRPRLLLADEPTGQLDQETGASIMRLLLDVVRAEGTTALISTHDATLQGLADASIRLTDGRVDPAGA